MALIAYCELRPLGPGHARWNRRHPFDRTHGVRTSRVLPGFLLKPDDPVDFPNIAYVPAQPSIVRAALALIPDPQRCHFLDIGCGKGRPLLIAAEFDFRAITGIELSPTLAWIARRNAAIYAQAHPQRSRIDVVTGDALRCVLPNERLVVFLYHPFERSLIARLLANIEASLRKSKRDVYIVYYNPVFADVFDGSTSLKRSYAAQVPCDPSEIPYGPGESDTVVIWQNRDNPHPRPPVMQGRAPG
jgi:SAM-dependent methyltransferase